MTRQLLKTATIYMVHNTLKILQIHGRSPVISYVEQIQSFVEVAYRVWRYLLQEVDVVFRVETTHVVC